MKFKNLFDAKKSKKAWTSVGKSVTSGISTGVKETTKFVAQNVKTVVKETSPAIKEIGKSVGGTIGEAGKGIFGELPIVPIAIGGGLLIGAIILFK